MDFNEAMDFLNEASDPQIATIYQRRNIEGKVMGVRFGDLYKLIKRIKRDSALARQLWEVPEVEPKLVACRIMDPMDLTEAEIDRWISEVEFPVLADYVANLVYRTSFAEKKRIEWTASSKEHVRRAGFTLVYDYAADPKSPITNQELLAYLDQIGREIQSSPNWSKEMMNMVPIAIGLRDPSLKPEAIAVARGYGKVDVFHGDKTNCKVWDAVDALNDPKTRVKPPS